MSDLVDRLIAMKPRSYGPAGLFDLLGDAAAEVADLTKANGLLHAIVSNREEEIASLRAQLASAAATLADIENGLQSAQIRDLEGRLASARKALEAALLIVSDRCAGGRMITPREDASKAFYLIQSALSDEKGK